MCAESVILDGCVLAGAIPVHQPALNKALGVFVTEQDIFPVSVASGAEPCRTDTCVSAVAAVLLQDFENGLCVVVYVSRTLSGQERKYSVYELEALAVLFGVEKFRMYLEHSEFLLQTDNQALSWVWLVPVSLAVWPGQDMAPYKLREDILCSVTESDQKPKVVVPNELDQVVLKYYHDSPPGGHLGVYKSLAKIREQFTCKGMGNQVSQYVKACIAFGLSKPALRTKYGQLAPSLADRPVEKLFVDCVSFALMMGYTPKSPLSNFWSLNDLLPDSPDPVSLQRLWNGARRNLRLDYLNRADRHNRSRLQVPFKDVSASVWIIFPDCAMCGLFASLRYVWKRAVFTTQKSQDRRSLVALVDYDGL
ncbi:hypothetical protein ANN_19109 [Periplaneta americana]|uniref:RNA-directed DNA polymerase n=1 Tax=Periplaneta americana TaxID=6978 RepID=A0ABQ8S9V2_PERAM|nr:hypothetical protein ANN_19109 [Periplaneta americana]